MPYVPYVSTERDIVQVPKAGTERIKTGHDGVAKTLHWDLCKQFRFGTSDKWYEHAPDSVGEMRICE